MATTKPPTTTLPLVDLREHSKTDHPSSDEPRSVDDTASNDTTLCESAPDGGYAWFIVFACFIHMFWLNAYTGSWGILQVALLKTTLSGSSTSTVSFIGALGIAMGPALGVVGVRVAAKIGARWTSLIGILFYGVGNLIAAQAVSSVGGLFVASGVTYGISSGLMYTMCNTLPVQWFDNRLGTANGLIKLGGGIGATVMAIATGLLTKKVGIAWTFRIIGLASLATGIPAAFLIKERKALHSGYEVNWSVFKSGPFTCLFMSGAIGVLAIYTPSFFLPYIADALGFSPATSTGVVACFNASMALGRLLSGFACDRLGTMNIYLLTMALNTITFFAVWSTSSTLPILLVFAILNGIANGSFFVAMPTAVGRLLGAKDGAGGISISLLGWFPGLLVGTPIAGYLIDATGADKAHSIGPFRPAVFYAGGTALLSFAFVVIARLYMTNIHINKL